KAELLQALGQNKNLIEYCIDELLQLDKITKVDQFLAVSNFKPSLPNESMEIIVSSLRSDGIQPQKWADYIKHGSLSKQASNELKSYLLKTNQAFMLNEDTLIYKNAFDK